MVETTLVPRASKTRSWLTRLGSALTSPLSPDDYLALVRSTWSKREAIGTVVEVRREHGRTVTVVIRPNFRWPGHQPGQYLRVGLEVHGVRRWRAYTITSDPEHPEGFVSITVKDTIDGQVSPVLNRDLRPGRHLFLGDVEGEFTLDRASNRPLLFISAGSGVTPIVALLRELERRGELSNVVHIHSARSPENVILGDLLLELSNRNAGYQLIGIHTSTQDRFTPRDLDTHCPDWAHRQTFLCGPPDLIQAMQEHYQQARIGEQLVVEHFQPVIGNGGGDGDGGEVHFRVSDRVANCDGGMSILVGGVRAGAVRDLRTDTVEVANGQMVRTCINAPDGCIEIDL